MSGAVDLHFKIRQTLRMFDSNLISASGEREGEESIMVAVCLNHGNSLTNGPCEHLLFRMRGEEAVTEKTVKVSGRMVRDEIYNNKYAT